MSTQRSRAGRRGFLAALGAAATGGCVRSALGSEGAGSDAVSVLAAGSLQHALAENLDAAADVPTQVEARGSVAAARLVAGGERDPDIVALADTGLFDSVLAAPWHARVATNALVVAVADTPGGRRVRRADRWYDPVVAGAATLGRTDPDLDPLGYRTLFAVELEAERAGRPELPGRVLSRDQVYPETSLLSRLETGAVDAAVVYRSMATERDIPYVALPAAVDLSDPGRDATYADATYTLADGETVRGSHVAYGARARRTTPAVSAVFEALAAGAVLADAGFAVPESYPVYEGEVPGGLGG